MPKPNTNPIALKLETGDICRSLRNSLEIGTRWHNVLDGNEAIPEKSPSVHKRGFATGFSKLYIQQFYLRTRKLSVCK